MNHIPSYPHLLDREPQTLLEPRHGYQVITERHLQVVWLEQQLLHPLYTEDGERIEVLSPGIWNHEAGPDFLRGHIKIGDRNYRGDVELHLRDESWKTHKHHVDPRYDRVILHVALWPSHTKTSVITSSGRRVVCTHLEPYLKVPLEHLVGKIDLDLYPSRMHCGTGRCCDLVFSPLDGESTRSFLTHAAVWRLQSKAARLRTNAPHSQLALPFGIAQCLGYRHNAHAFGELFSTFEPHRHLPEETLYAALLGAAGFFSPKHRARWGESSRYRILYRTWCQGANPGVSLSLRLNGIRPLNHPIRRLAYLARLLKDPDLELIEGALLQCWRAQWPNAATELQTRRLIRTLLAIIPNYEDRYWREHSTFGSKGPVATLVGENLKTEMLINAVLPLLHSSIVTKNNTMELQAFLTMYHHLPAGSKSKAAYLQQRFFGEALDAPPLKHAIYQQGAFQLHNDFCNRFEASCVGCPFPERFLQRKEATLRQDVAEKWTQC